MMQVKQSNIFDEAGQLLREYKFSLAFKIACQASRQYKLYDDYRQEFGNIRLLAFEAHDFALGSEKLTALLRKLSDELRTRTS